MDQKVNRGGLFSALNSALLLTGVVALFFLLTNGVPLVQLGWMKELGKKSRYVNLTILFVSVFSVFLFGARFLMPQSFPKFWPVRLWKSLCDVPPLITAAALFVIYATVMTIVGFERQAALQTRAFDLGIFAQAVWNTIHGDLFFSSIKENINLMGDHVSPILILAAPFYAIWPDLRTLVLLQALAAASSFFPLALIVRDKLKDRPLILVFLLMFFFFQPMRAALHEDFHPEVLAEPFLWWAFLFLDRGKVVRFLLCLAVAVTGKENFAGIAFMFGFYAFLWKRMRGVGVAVMLGSLGLFIWETRWLIPHLSGAPYFYGGNYSQMLMDPASGFVKRLFSGESAGYVLKVFLPFLYLPFFNLPTLILTFPILFQNLLSANGPMRSFNYHYFTGLTPFLFISTVFSFDQLRRRSGWIGKNCLFAGLLLLFVGVLRSGPSEYWFFRDIHAYRNAHTEMVRGKLRTIPPDARVLTHNSFIPQLCNRKFIYQFNYNAAPTKLDFARKYKADTVVWDAKFWEPQTASPESTLAEFKDSGYRVSFERDGFYILVRDGSL